MSAGVWLLMSNTCGGALIVIYAAIAENPEVSVLSRAETLSEPSGTVPTRGAPAETRRRRPARGTRDPGGARCRFPIEVADSHEKWRVGGGFPPEVAKMFGADCCF